MEVAEELVVRKRLIDVEQYHLMGQVGIGRHSEPDPDFALLEPRADDHKGELPQARDVLLLVEVAESSLRYDRQIKLPLYAQHGIPEVWILDVPAKSLTLHRDPAGGVYRETSTITVATKLRRTWT